MNNRALLFIYNPKSGMGLVKNHLADIIDMMVKSGFEVTAYPTQGRADATRKVKEEGARFERIVCCGGDGTLDEVITGVNEANLSIPIGYIPAGSTNDFAKSLGIGGDMRKTAEVALGDLCFACDIGTFNEDTFVYIAAFGLFTEVSYETPQELKNALGHLAYILSAAKSLAEIPNYQMRITTDEGVIEGRFVYGMVTNSTSVGGIKGMTGKEVRMDDGKFEVTLIKTPSNIVELNQILGFLTNLRADTDMVYSFKTDHIEITSEKPVAWTLDGEFGGNHSEVRIRNLQQKVDIFVKDVI